jgi:hypothetical protein
LIREFKGESDTPEVRKRLAEREATKLKTYLTVPAEVRDHVYEGFEPLMVAGEVIDKHFILVLNSILDFNESRSDDEFI